MICSPSQKLEQYYRILCKQPSKQLKDILLKLDQMKATWKGTHILVDMEKNQFIENDEPMRFVLELGEFFLGKKLILRKNSAYQACCQIAEFLMRP